MVSSPVALRIMAVETPHPTDPSDADLFYAALGRFTVAWGRFEGHFTGAILALHNLQGYAYASTTPIPMSWKRRAATWRKGFNELVELAPLRPRAMTYIERVMNEVNGRHIGAHAIWDTFTVPAAEPTMKARLISAKRDHPGMIDVADYELRVSMLKAALFDVNQLNRDLLPFTTFFDFLRPAPEGTKKF
jgi:hypothetical protein